MYLLKRHMHQFIVYHLERKISLQLILHHDIHFTLPKIPRFHRSGWEAIILHSSQRWNANLLKCFSILGHKYHTTKVFSKESFIWKSPSFYQASIYWGPTIYEVVLHSEETKPKINSSRSCSFEGDNTFTNLYKIYVTWMQVGKAWATGGRQERPRIRSHVLG